MVQTDLAISVLQLVGLSLPAYAILLEIMVESEYAYANLAVPVVALSFGLVVSGGTVVLTAFLLSPRSLLMQIALVFIDVGLLGMLVAIYLIGFRTKRAQERIAE